MNPYQEIIRVAVGTPDLPRSALLIYLAAASAGGEAKLSKLASNLQMPGKTARNAATSLVDAGLCTRAYGSIKISQIK